MKKLLFIALLIFIGYKWTQYSSPGDYSREEIESISSPSTLSAIKNDPRLLDQPHLVRCRITHGAGVRRIGYCILEQDGHQLLTLTKGFPPPSGQEVSCYIIPRAFLVVEGHYYLVAAMAPYRPVAEAEGAISQQ